MSAVSKSLLGCFALPSESQVTVLYISSLRPDHLLDFPSGMRRTQKTASGRCALCHLRGIKSVFVCLGNTLLIAVLVYQVDD